MELELGVLRLERKDVAQGKLLRTWLEDHELSANAGRILPVDTFVGLRCAALHLPDPRSERDALIAATASVHGMTGAGTTASGCVPMGHSIPTFPHLTSRNPTAIGPGGRNWANSGG